MELGADLYFSTELADDHRIIILIQLGATQCFARADLTAQNLQKHPTHTHSRLESHLILSMSGLSVLKDQRLLCQRPKWHYKRLEFKFCANLPVLR